MKISGRKVLPNSALRVAAYAALFLVGKPSIGAQSAGPAIHFAFDVVSIRQSGPGGQQHFGATATGFQATNLSLMTSVILAYLPLSGEAYYTSGRIQGTPEWANLERYNVDAKVSDADAAEWQKPEAQRVMLRAMLQTMLADRCKLVVHRDSKETTVFELVIGKSGPKFKEAVPDAPHAQGVTLPGGGTLVPSGGPSGGGGTLTLYSATMVSLAQVLSNFEGHPVKDKTGLTGKYDFTLTRSEPVDASGGPATAGGPPTYAVEPLGLRLERSKAVVDTLVIDHMERPSGN